MTPMFINRAVLEQRADGDTWVLVEPLEFFSDALQRTIIVPTGFRTDLASIPRLFWNILPPFGRYTDAAVVHDYLYTTQECSRENADAVLMEAMKARGVSWFKRQIIYQNVRMFGGLHWERKKTNGK